MEQGFVCRTFALAWGCSRTEYFFFCAFDYGKFLLMTMTMTMVPTTPRRVRHGKPSKSKTQIRTLKRKRDEEDLLKLAQAIAELVSGWCYHGCFGHGLTSSRILQMDGSKLSQSCRYQSQRAEVLKHRISKI
jgi:hypothetical protein